MAKKKSTKKRITKKKTTKKKVAKKKPTKKKPTKKKPTKKKTTKKKATKKKPVKKKVAKKTPKKKKTAHTKPVKKEVEIQTRKPKKEKIDSMELLYKLIHSVQVLKKDASLTIEDESLKPIIINILKDSGVEYQENIFHKKTLIRLIPDHETFEEDIDLEEIDKDFIFDITSL